MAFYSGRRTQQISMVRRVARMQRSSSLRLNPYTLVNMCFAIGAGVRNAQHYWDENHATRLGFSGWDMLSLGINVLIGGTGHELVIIQDRAPQSFFSLYQWDQKHEEEPVSRGLTIFWVFLFFLFEGGGGKSKATPSVLRFVLLCQDGSKRR